MSRAASALATVAIALLTLTTSAQAAAPAMRMGFSDLSTVQFGDPLQRPLELAHLKATRATAIRIMLEWRSVETRRADPATAGDPANPAYDWTDLDALLRDVTAAGVRPLLMVSAAPSWWEGAGRPPVSTPTAPAGTWKPDPRAYGRFMTAAARRYDGAYPDPLHPGATLPRVRDWQVWNEPNLSNDLTPQWVRDASGHYRAESPTIYRRLLSAGYDAIKAAAADNVVVTAGTAPYGDVPGGLRIQPARFVRALLCVTGREHPKARNCRATPAKFDVLAHHPYPIGPPGRTAINADDVAVPDFSRLQRPLAVALAAGNVFPRTRKPIWATEMSWDSSPPDPNGIPAAEQARYLAGAVYVLWRQGVRALYWWNLRDDAKGAGYQYTLQSGVYERGATVAQDTAKPSLTAFRFPFVAYRAYSKFAGHGSARLWGMAPAPGAVSIQRLIGSSWTTVRTVRASADHVFSLRLAAGRGARLRAVQAGEASVDAKVF